MQAVSCEGTTSDATPSLLSTTFCPTIRGKAELPSYAACCQLRLSVARMHLRQSHSGRTSSGPACTPEMDGAVSNGQSQWSLQEECMRQAEQLSLRASVKRAGWRPLHKSALPVLMSDPAGFHLRIKSMLMLMHVQCSPFTKGSAWQATCASIMR